MDTAEWLIEQGSHVDGPTSDGTPLIQVCVSGRWEDALRLIKLGATVTTALNGHPEKTPLYVLCSTGCDCRVPSGCSSKHAIELELAKQMVAAGAQVVYQTPKPLAPWELALESPSNSARYSPILSAIQKHDAAFLDVLMRACANPLGALVPDARGYTPLALACLDDRDSSIVIPVLERLIKAGLSACESDDQGLNAIQVLASHSSIQDRCGSIIAEFLLARGANAASRFRRNAFFSYDRSAALNAFIERKWELCKLLYDNGGGSQEDASSMLNISVTRPSTHPVQIFLSILENKEEVKSRQINLPGAWDERHFSFLNSWNDTHFELFNREVLRVLSNMNLKCTSLLSIACLSPTKIAQSLVKALLEHGADPCEASRDTGRTPLEIAMSRANFEVVRVLLNTGKPKLDLQHPGIGRLFEHALSKCLHFGGPSMRFIRNLLIDYPPVEKAGHRLSPYIRHIFRIASENLANLNFFKKACISLDMLIRSGVNPNRRNSKGNNAAGVFFSFCLQDMTSLTEFYLRDCLAPCDPMELAVADWHDVFVIGIQVLFLGAEPAIDINQTNKYGYSAADYLQMLLSPSGPRKTDPWALEIAKLIGDGLELVGKGKKRVLQLKDDFGWTTLGDTLAEDAPDSYAPMRGLEPWQDNGSNSEDECDEGGESEY